MELFTKTKAVKLRSHLGKYLVADDDQESVRQSRSGGGSRKARWLVEVVDHPHNHNHALRLKSWHGRYLWASDQPLLLGMTGNKVVQKLPVDLKEFWIEWEPIRDGFQVKLRAFGGTFLRGNGGTPPWRNSVTHDTPYTGSTQRWILWDVLPVDVPDDGGLSDYLEMVSSFSSVSDEVSSLEIGSPVSANSVNSSRLSIKKSPLVKRPAMDLFTNAKAVRLRSHHGKYLTADEDEESVTQDRNGSSKNARWYVELVDNAENIIRLKSCYNKYLMASNNPFLLGMTGHKVLQTLPRRLDSSVEWEPIRERVQVKLKTRYGQFLRGNGGLPPWRNSVTHDVPHRTATQDWVLWDVDVVEIIDSSPAPMPHPQLVVHSDSFTSEVSSPATQYSDESLIYSRQESGDSLISSPPTLVDGRTIYFHLADENGNVDEGFEELCITFKGNGVEELTRKLGEELGLDDIVVCSRSPLNGNLYPLRLQLPPNNVSMHVVVIPSSSGVASDL